VDCKGVQSRISPNGSLTVMPTPEQIAATAECEAKKEELVKRWRTKQRSDANLRAKYPDEATLRTARDADLESARASVRRSQDRLTELGKEHEKLRLEKEFYPNGAPADLQRKIDQNDALIAAQESLLKKAREDVANVEASFDKLLAYMKVLWTARPEPMPTVDCSIARSRP